MMSTPISRLRGDGDHEDSVSDISSEPELTAPPLQHEHMLDAREGEIEDDEDQAPIHVPKPRSRKPSRRNDGGGGARRVRFGSVSDADEPAPWPTRPSGRRGKRSTEAFTDYDVDAFDRARANSGHGGFFTSPLWRAVFSRAFAQAIVLSFALIAAVALSPAAAMILDRAPILSKLPRAETLIMALIAALVVTAARPPVVFADA